MSDLTKEELDRIIYWTGEEVWIDFGMWCRRKLRPIMRWIAKVSA